MLISAPFLTYLLSKLPGEYDMKEFVKLQDITKIYKMGEVEIRAADCIKF